jgi:hypothetical protein
MWCRPRSVFPMVVRRSCWHELTLLAGVMGEVCADASLYLIAFTFNTILMGRW